jgi:hypothetical protein
MRAVCGYSYWQKILDVRGNYRARPLTMAVHGAISRAPVTQQQQAAAHPGQATQMGRQQQPRQTKWSQWQQQWQQWQQTWQQQMQALAVAELNARHQGAHYAQHVQI